MAVSQANIVFPGTKFRILEGDYDPEDSADFPATTVAYMGSWTGLDDLGYTKGGVMIQINRTIQDEYFDQDIDPALQIVTQRDLRLRTVLGEATPEHIVSALGYADVVTTPSTTSVKGTKLLKIKGTLPPIEDKVVGMEAQMRNGQPLRALLYRTEAVANVELGFMKNQTVNVPFEARAMNDTQVTDGQVFALQQVLPLAAA